MQIHPRQTLARKRINRLRSAIQKAIDDICTEDNFEITYSEINNALLDVLKSNNAYELRQLWEESEDKEV